MLVKGMGYFFGVVIILGSAFSARAATVNFYDRIHSHIKSTVWPMPQISKDSGDYRLMTCHEKAPSEIEAMFNLLQMHSFGALNFELRFCMVNVAMVDLEHRRVYIERRFFEALRAHLPQEEYHAAAALILAHELGHYFYERTWELEARSLLGFNFSWYDIQVGDEEKYVAHGEIDAYGLALVELSGLDVEAGAWVLPAVRSVLGTFPDAPPFGGLAERQSVIELYLSCRQESLKSR